MAIESIKVPDLGGATAVEVIEICVAVGDEIAKDDSLMVLESDKASMEVPSPKAGRVTAVKVTSGDALSAGDVILELEVAADEADKAPDESSDDGKQPARQEATPSEEQTSRDETSAKSKPAPQPAPKKSTSTKKEGAAGVAAVTVPDLGGAEEVDVIEVSVKAGDTVAEGDALIVLESDKASMEVPSPRSGKVTSVSVSEGDKVKSGMQILQLESADTAEDAGLSTETAATATTAAEKAVPEKAESQPTSSNTKTKSQSEIPAPSFAATRPAQPGSEPKTSTSTIYAGPAVRKLAREMGIVLEKVKGTGPRGRITKDNLKAFVKTAFTEKTPLAAGGAIPAVPEVDFSRFGEISTEPLSKIHKVTAESMHRSWLNVPHVTQFDDADITELEAFRDSLRAEAEQRGVKLTPIPFLLKACAAALKANPKFNASLHADGVSMVYKHYVHIGMAVDTPAGLVVPVLRDVDKKSIWTIAEEVAALAQKARDRKLAPADMQGGCFSISSLGNIGGQGFTPIVNTPEVAILGVSKLTTKPVWDGSAFVPRKMLPLSLSYDHRAVNGADAGRFLTFLTGVLADIRRLVL